MDTLTGEAINFCLDLFNGQPDNDVRAIFFHNFLGVAHKVKPLIDELLLHRDYCNYDGGHLYAKLARHVFADGNVNWGRIVVMLIAALEMKARHGDNDNNEFATVVAHTLMRHAGEWILRAGGWRCAFLDF